MENLRFDSSTALILAADRQRSVRAQVTRRPRRVWAAKPTPKIEHGVTATPRIPQPRPAESSFAPAHDAA